MSAERQTSMLCFKDVQAPPSPTRFSSQRLIGLWTWEQSCIPRRHFPQTSAQIVGNKGEPEAEVCGARDVPEGTVSCSWRRLWMPGSHGVGTSADTARMSACATSDSPISSDLHRGLWKVIDGTPPLSSHHRCNPVLAHRATARVRAPR